MRIFGLKNCDTCRKARKALPDAEFSDVRESPLSDADLDAALAEFGSDLVNRRSTTWRELDESQRNQEDRALLRAYPTLMKRPLIMADGALFLGWTKDVQSAVAERS
ncbi:ArsC/Spx/MgsR family protein [Pseudooceanicola sp. C21-150M6]|uniref:ArsC/Spx/MgsR family protein n=1 Tax=Pseudooceanicola sp. C21-150M6 TaxID=3434355 RepID=UPI003D7FAA9F